MTVNQEQLVEIAQTVWSSFLGMGLIELATDKSSATDEGHSASATVHISGSWNGSVILSCNTSLARRAAAAMFEMDDDEVGDSELSDAFGELANIIGGNMKCLLPEPSQLSLPTVSMGAVHVVTVPGAALLEHVELDCDGDQLRIAVWNRRDDKHREHHLELEGLAR